MSPAMMLTPMRKARFALGILLFVGASFLNAQEATLPGIEDLQHRLGALEQARELPDADKKEIGTAYRLAIDRLRTAAQLDEEARGYSRALVDLPRERARLSGEQQSYRPPTISPALERASLASLEQRLAEADGQVAELRARLSELRSGLQAERSLALQQLITEAQQAAQRPASTALPADATSEQTQLASAVARAAERRMQQAQIEALGQRLASRPARLEVMEAEADLLALKLQGAEAYQASLRTLSNRRRQTGSAALVAELEDFAQTLLPAPEDLRRLADGNVELARALNDLAGKQQQAETQLARLQADVAILDGKFQSLNRLLALEQFESSSVFGAALRQERDRASQTTAGGVVRTAVGQELTASRVALFHLDERRAPYTAPTRADLEAILGPATGQWAAAMDKVLERRYQLVASLTNAHAAHIDELSALLTNLSYLSERSAAYGQLLENNLFWIPSAEPMGRDTLAAVGTTLAWLVMPDHWQQVGRTVRSNLSDHWPKLTVLVSLLAATLIARRPLRRRLADMKPHLGKVSSDRFALTIEAFWITAVLALPLPLLLYAGSQLAAAGSGFSSSLAKSLSVGGLVLLFMEFMRQLVRSNGVAELHFQVSRSAQAFLRRNNRWLIAVIVPIVVVMVLLDEQATPDIRDGLGRIALVALCLSLAVFGGRLVRSARTVPGSADGTPRRWYAVYVGDPALVFVPLALMSLSLLGFHYSAKQLLALILESIVVVTVAALTYHTLVRAFAVSERRLALSRRVDKRSAATAKSADRDAAERAAEGIPENIDEQEIDRHAITTQTKAMIRLLVSGGAIVGLSTVWRDLLPIVRSLDEVVVWQSTSGNGLEPLQAVTLWSLLVASVVVTVSIVAVRNLPGVLEVAILSRLNLAPGTGYAVTTVLKYAIVFVGLLAAANLLGADWSRLQWLVAALGVGLGFGLQEIVANFVSGIVILFERPFRLGDTVTIAGHTGTVARIQIRATTISDWDRKELIIPNKAFITENFINWTLSDPITRVVIPVGVAYGADTEKVIATLLDVARKDAHAFDDPSPAALFTGFGDSTLNFELRVFAGSVLDRATIAHELHMAIAKAFREQGIEISYPQRDVHIDSSSPIEVVLKPRSPAT